MKNIKKEQLKKCIIMPISEFVSLMESFGLISEVDYEGAYFSMDGEDVTKEEVYGILSNHFGVKVTSLHVDDCDDAGVWVVYKDAESEKSEASEVPEEMQKFIVSIEETLQRDVIVLAHDQAEADEITENLCNRGVIDLDMNDWCHRTLDSEPVTDEDGDAYQSLTMYDENGELRRIKQ